MKNAPPDSSSGAGKASPLNNLLQSLLGAVRPPEWVVDEVQNRVVLFLNHVLMQEDAARDRLRRQKAKSVRLQWGDFHLTLAPTAAGLLERSPPVDKPDLSVILTERSPLLLTQGLLAGQKPAVDIQGDVQLAAEVAWLVDNVRWDVEEDLSRVFGDAAAHGIAGFARSAAEAVKAFVERLPAARAPRGAAGDAVPPRAGESSA